MEGIENDLYARAEQILEEIRLLNQDYAYQMSIHAKPEAVTGTLQQLKSLYTDLACIRTIMFVPEVLSMEKEEKEFFFNYRLPRVMKTLNRHHN